MNKAITEFSSYSGAELLPVATTVNTQLLSNLVTFPSLPFPPATLGPLVVTYKDALAKKESNATADFIAFEVARANLEEALGDDGGYVNIVAKGDATIVASSGYPSYETGAAPDYSPPLPPTNVTLRQGIISGSFVARYRPARRRSVNEVQTCSGDPGVEANWKTVGLFNGGKASLAGYTPGMVVWLRVRTVGLQNVMGAWSDPAKLMVV